MTRGSVGAQAFWVVQPGVGELRSLDVPAPERDQVRIRTLFSGVSRGTESLVFHGRVPRAEHERMRGPHQEGSLALPVKYGYCLIGEVTEGEGAGRRVFCLHPHQSWACVESSMVTELPGTLPPGRAVLTANMETALNATWDGGVSPGDRVVVVGGGVVGCLVAYLCGRIPGTNVQLVDVDERREAVASALGVDFAVPPGTWSEADVVFHASATSAGLQTAVDASGLEARIVEVSWYGDKPVSLELGAQFHPGRLQIVSSQVGRIPASRAARWSYGRRLRVALELLCDDVLDVLISGESPFETMPAVMSRILAPASERSEPVLCHRICY
ncbi:MAG: zinc-dependent alcohol dehydrogenase [Nannocystales bacterium]